MVDAKRLTKFYLHEAEPVRRRSKPSKPADAVKSGGPLMARMAHRTVSTARLDSERRSAGVSHRNHRNRTYVNDVDGVMKLHELCRQKDCALFVCSDHV